MTSIFRGFSSSWTISLRGSVILSIELYTDTLDVRLEYDIETLLKNYGLSWSKEAAYIDSERMWQTTYQMEVFING